MKLGGNLLNLALKVIPKQTVLYSQFTGRTTNSIGLDVISFAAAVNVTGSFQPVPREKIENMGLDYNKSYCNFYTSTPLADLMRDTAGDRFVFGGRTYQVMSNIDWTNVDAWLCSLAVAIS
jgi:hypothetical protein